MRAAQTCSIGAPRCTRITRTAVLTTPLCARNHRRQLRPVDLVVSLTIDPCEEIYRNGFAELAAGTMCVLSPLFRSAAGEERQAKAVVEAISFTIKCARHDRRVGSDTVAFDTLICRIPARRQFTHRSDTCIPRNSGRRPSVRGARGPCWTPRRTGGSRRASRHALANVEPASLATAPVIWGRRFRTRNWKSHAKGQKLLVGATLTGHASLAPGQLEASFEAGGRGFRPVQRCAQRH